MTDLDKTIKSRTYYRGRVTTLCNKVDTNLATMSNEERSATEESLSSFKTLMRETGQKMRLTTKHKYLE